MNQDVNHVSGSGAVRVYPASAIRLRGPCALGLDVWDTPLSRAPAAAVIAAYCALCTTVSLIPLPILPSLGPSTDRTRRRWVRAGVGRAGGCGFGTDGNDRPAPARLVLPCGADCTVTVGGDPNFLSRDRSGSDAPRFFTCICSWKHPTPGTSTSTILAASCEGLCNWACGVWPAWRGRRLLCLTT